MNYKQLIIVCLSIIFVYYIFSTLIFSEKSDDHFDLIIVGSGLAGLNAAIESYRVSQGKVSIAVIESEPTFGGNSRKATSGINFLNTSYQLQKGINDSFQLFYGDTMASGKEKSNPDLVRTLVKESENLFLFYKNFGINLSSVNILGGHSVPRTHRPPSFPIGNILVTSIYNLLLHDSTVSFKFNCTVTELIYDKKFNKVKGVKYISKRDQKTRTLRSRSVILASGGFGHDFSEDSLLKEYIPNFLTFPTTNGKGSQGIGIKIAKNIGSDLVGMEYVQIHPTGFVDPKERFQKNKILGPELLRGVGGILINQKGNRFCNELSTRDYVVQKILENCDKFTSEDGKSEQYEAFIILNSQGIESYGNSVKFYIGKGLLNFYKNFGSFAKAYNISEVQLNKTIAEYNEFSKNGADKFNKTVFPTQFDYNSEIYVGIVTPSIHYTMGGIKINPEAEVIAKDQNVIKGLYGAGEVTGGVHGANRLGGNSLLECGVFGRIAGRSAIEYILFEENNKNHNLK